MESTNWQQISDKELWDRSLLASPSCNFLQSSSFGDFHEQLGNLVWRFGRSIDDKIVSFAQVIKVKSKLGNFLYVPWGPILDKNQDLHQLLETLKKLGKKEKASFIRLEPRVELEGWRQESLREVVAFTQPQCSLVLSLTKSLEELRFGFSESTRYNVGWVERQGVTVEVSDNQADIEIFMTLLRETAARQKFTLHQSPDYYKKQFYAFAKSGLVKLFIARAPVRLGHEPLAAAIVVSFGATVTYLHAASSSKEQKLRAPYLMQWRAIEEAKKSGAKYYDFWGVAPTDDPNETWAGVSAFKKSFGGERVCYPKPYDLVLSKRYYLFEAAAALRTVVKLLRR